MTSDDLAQSIKAAALRLVEAAGAGGLDVESVAAADGRSSDEVGSVFGSVDELLTALIIDAYNASGEAMERADDPSARPGARMLAITRALREWSLANRAAFTLIYGSPIPGYHAPEDTVGPASRTPAAIARVLRSAMESGAMAQIPRPYPSPSLVTEESIALFGGEPDPGYEDLIERGVGFWSNLVGLLVFELFSRTHDSVTDQSAFFDYSIAAAVRGLGLTVEGA
ncbi:TetR-like C-terminal domain-containing protein [Sciscionella marina]|uniref:TetR-like C-terminal domain-containing protein n=1 Tax=Sciscionella marina TaxID=508770 RepID=UPI00037A1478|nr:TetR-like C-terminal domain-containing protein [Sciscionella marina]